MQTSRALWQKKDYARRRVQEVRPLIDGDTMNTEEKIKS